VLSFLLSVHSAIGNPRFKVIKDCWKAPYTYTSSTKLGRIEMDSSELRWRLRGLLSLRMGKLEFLHF
jgi:hypothetical protein